MSHDPLPPITLGEVRRLGFPLIVTCAICNRTRRRSLYIARRLPDGATMQDLAKRIRCSQCKLSPGAAISVQPQPRLWVAHLRRQANAIAFPLDTADE